MASVSPKTPDRRATTGSKARAFTIRRIVVPLDLSGHAREALFYALPLAEKFSARIVLLHVIPPRLTDRELSLSTTEESAIKRKAKRELDEVASSLDEPSSIERSIIAVGHAAEVIVTTADRIGADMIVLTTHGRSGLKRFLMGSTAELVIRHAKVPVMVVRRR